MLGEFGAAVSSAKALYDLAKAGGAVIDQAKLANAMFDVNEKLMNAQAVALSLLEDKVALQDRVRTLEEEKYKREAWDVRAEPYHITEVAPGIFVLIDKAVNDKYQEAVKLCTNCFEDRFFSVLQLTPSDINRSYRLKCVRCKADHELTHFLK